MFFDADECEEEEEKTDGSLLNRFLRVWKLLSRFLVLFPTVETERSKGVLHARAGVRRGRAEEVEEKELFFLLLFFSFFIF